MRFALAVGLSFFFATVVYAQQPASITVPEIHAVKLSGSSAAFVSTPPDIVLTAKGAGARPGRLWIRNTGDGLLIAGDVHGGRPDFPRDQKSLPAKDHVEVWLAAGDDPIFPPIGWGNQFGETQLPNGAASCSNPDSEQGSSMFEPNSPKARHDCREWAKTQETYRHYFERLFLRQWELAPGYNVESFATPAYQEISDHFAGLYDGSIDDDSSDELKPRGNPKFWYSATPKGYSFEILIPYTSFPPLPSLELTNLRLLVDVFSAAPAGQKSGAYSTSSTSRVLGDASTFNQVTLDPPRVFHMTPCDMPLTGRNVYGTMRDAWFIPQANQPERPGATGKQSSSGDALSEYQSDAFVIVNEAGGYWYDPKGLSPIAHPVHDFWTSVGPGEWVCGPQLTHAKDGHTVNFEQQIDRDGLATRRLPTGDLLVKSGPFVDTVSAFGAGQCGNCSYTDLEIFRITPEEKIERVLKLGDTLMGMAPFPIEEDFSITPDWSHITDFQESVDGNGESGPWSSTTYCLEDSRYNECDRQDNVKPPNSPLLGQEQ